MRIRTRENDIAINGEYMLLLLAKIHKKVKPTRVLDYADGIYYTPLLIAYAVSIAHLLTGLDLAHGIISVSAVFMNVYILVYFGVRLGPIYEVGVLFAKYRRGIFLIAALGLLLSAIMGFHVTRVCIFLFSPLLIQLVMKPMDFALEHLLLMRDYKYRERSFIYAYRMMAWNVGEDGSMTVRYGGPIDEEAVDCLKKISQEDESLIVKE